MSARISMLRDTLAGLVTAAALPVASGPLTVALRRATRALTATRFVVPGTFPAVVSTRSGVIVTLHALHEGRLIGSYVDGDGLQLNSWACDGAMFSPDDPDDFDLVCPEDVLTPEDAPAPDLADSNVVAFDYRDSADVVRVPVLGRIS